ncbi:MAG: hypothetical protein PHF67_04665 [Candidatus Nanoarchaeia archaeon]|nr:hypothetical protein [Candidatus Nanoarchaeia archaeon]
MKKESKNIRIRYIIILLLIILFAGIFLFNDNIKKSEKIISQSQMYSEAVRYELLEKLNFNAVTGFDLSEPEPTPTPSPNPSTSPSSACKEGEACDYCGNDCECKKDPACDGRKITTYSSCKLGSTGGGQPQCNYAETESYCPECQKCESKQTSDSEGNPTTEVVCVKDTSSAVENSKCTLRNENNEPLTDENGETQYGCCRTGTCSSEPLGCTSNSECGECKICTNGESVAYTEQDGLNYVVTIANARKDEAVSFTFSIDNNHVGKSFAVVIPGDKTVEMNGDDMVSRIESSGSKAYSLSFTPDGSTSAGSIPITNFYRDENQPQQCVRLIYVPKGSCGGETCEDCEKKIQDKLKEIANGKYKDFIKLEESGNSCDKIQKYKDGGLDTEAGGVIVTGINLGESKEILNNILVNDPANEDDPEAQPSLNNILENYDKITNAINKFIEDNPDLCYKYSMETGSVTINIKNYAGDICDEGKCEKFNTEGCYIKEFKCIQKQNGVTLKTRVSEKYPDTTSSASLSKEKTEFEDLACYLCPEGICESDSGCDYGERCNKESEGDETGTCVECEKKIDEETGEETEEYVDSCPNLEQEDECAECEDGNCPDPQDLIDYETPWMEEMPDLEINYDAPCDPSQCGLETDPSSCSGGNCGSSTTTPGEEGCDSCECNKKDYVSSCQCPSQEEISETLSSSESSSSTSSSDSENRNGNLITGRVITGFQVLGDGSGSQNSNGEGYKTGLCKEVKEEKPKCEPETSGLPQAMPCTIVQTDTSASKPTSEEVIKKIMDSDIISKCLRITDEGMLTLLTTGPDCSEYADDVAYQELYLQYYKLVLALFQSSPTGEKTIEVKKLNDETQTSSVTADRLMNILKNHWSNPTYQNEDTKKKLLNLLIIKEQSMEAKGADISDIRSFINQEIILNPNNLPVDKSKVYLMLSNLALNDLKSGTPLNEHVAGFGFPGDSGIPPSSNLNLALEYGKRALDNCQGSDCSPELMELRQTMLKTKVLGMMNSAFSKGLESLTTPPPSGPELSPPGWERIRSWAEYYNKRVGQGYGELLCPFSPSQLKSSNDLIKANAMLRYQAGISGLIDILNAGMDIKNDYLSLSTEERLQKLSEIYTNVKKDDPLLKKLACSIESATLDLEDAKKLINDDYSTDFVFLPPPKSDSPYSAVSTQEMIDYQIMTSVNAQLITQKATQIAIAAGLLTGATEIYSLVAAGAYMKAGVSLTAFFLVGEGFGVLHEEVESVAGDVVADFTDLIAMVGIGYGMKSAHNYFVKPSTDPAIPTELIVKGVSDNVRSSILDQYKARGATVSGGANSEYTLTFKDGKTAKLRFTEESPDLSKAYEVKPSSECKDGVDPANAKSNGCFLANTQIKMADGTYKNIQDIRVGEKVTAFDLENNKPAIAPVTATFVHDANEYYIIEYEIVK